jgi:hypothetical protein
MMLKLQTTRWISRTDGVFGLHRVPEIPETPGRMVCYDFSPHVTEEFMSHRFIDICARIRVEPGWVICDLHRGIKPLTRYSSKATRRRSLGSSERRVGIGNRRSHYGLVLGPIDRIGSRSGREP